MKVDDDDHYDDDDDNENSRNRCYNGKNENKEENYKKQR